MAKTIVIDTEVKGVDQAVSDINKIDNAVDDVNKKSISPKFDSAKTEASLGKLQKKGEQIEKVGQGIAGGFALATGVVGAFGSELGFSSEEIEKAQAKASSFVSILTSIKPVIEGVGAGFQLLKNANPFGVIATIVGILIATFGDMGAIVDGIKKGFKVFGDAVSATFDFIVDAAMFAIDMYTKFLDVITFGLFDINGSYKSYTKSVNDASAAEKKREEIAIKELSLILKNISELKNKIKVLNEEIKITEKAKAAMIARYDQEIRLLQASGKETYATEKQKLADVILFTEKEIQQKLKVYLANKALQEEEAKANKKLLGENLAGLVEAANDTEQVNIKANNVRVKELAALRAEVNAAKNDDAVLDAGRNKEGYDKWKEIEDRKTAAILEANKIRTEKQNEYLDTIARLQDENFESTLSAQAIEERAVNAKYFELEEAAKNNAEELAIITKAKQRELGAITKKYTEEENRLIKEANDIRVQKQNEYLDTVAELQLENFESKLTEEDREVRAVKAKYFELEEAAKDNADELKIINEAKARELGVIDKKYRDEDKEHQRKVQDAKVQMVSDTLSTLSSLTELFGKKGEASAKKAFQVNKAISIADAIIKTYQGANAIFATASANPTSVLFPAQPFIAAGLAIAGGFANVAKIASTQFGGGGSASGGGGDSGFGSGASLPTVDTSSTPFQFPTAGDNNPQANQQTFVSVTEINNVNNRVQVAEANATFG